MLDTNGDEIGPGLAVIVAFEADGSAMVFEAIKGHGYLRPTE